MWSCTRRSTLCAFAAARTVNSKFTRPRGDACPVLEARLRLVLQHIPTLFMVAGPAMHPRSQTWSRHGFEGFCERVLEGQTNVLRHSSFGRFESLCDLFTSTVLKAPKVLVAASAGVTRMTQLGVLMFCLLLQTPYRMEHLFVAIL